MEQQKINIKNYRYMKVGILNLLLIFATIFAFGQNDFRCITDSLDAIEVEKNPIILSCYWKVGAVGR